LVENIIFDQALLLTSHFHLSYKLTVIIILIYSSQALFLINNYFKPKSHSILATGITLRTWLGLFRRVGIDWFSDVNEFRAGAAKNQHLIDFTGSSLITFP